MGRAATPGRDREYAALGIVPLFPFLEACLGLKQITPVHTHLLVGFWKIPTRLTRITKG